LGFSFEASSSRFLLQINTSLAPSLGLYLDRPFFEWYNRDQEKLIANIASAKAKRPKRETSGGEGVARRALEWETGPVAAELVAFREKVIWKHVFRTEAAESVFVRWLAIEANYPHSYQPVAPTQKS